MRRLLTLSAGLLLSAASVFAATETIYLKNGSVIKGEVIEQVPGKSLKIKTRDGSIFVYQMDEVEKITKENKSTVSTDGSCNIRHKGLDFSIGTGYNIGTKGGSGNIPVDLILSKRLSPNFSLGLGSGVQIPAGDGDAIIPIYADFKGFFPLSSTQITPFGDIQLGYAINTAGDKTVGSGKHAITVSTPNFVMFSIMPGVRIPLNHRTDVDLSVGYQHYVPTEGNGGSGAIAFKVGFNFHRSTDPNFMSRIKPEVPTRNTGFEFGIEGFGVDEIGLGMQLGYKFSPQLSFALGLSYGARSEKNTEMSLTYFRQPDGQGDMVGEQRSLDYDDDIDIEPFKFFLRGEYRLNNNRFSPVASVDLGYRKICYEEMYISSPLQDNEISGNGIFCRPAIGISWRTTNNSYLEARVGYEITNGYNKIDKVINQSGNLNGYQSNHFESIHIKKDGCNLSGLYVSIGWKRTFSLFSKD